MKAGISVESDAPAHTMSWRVVLLKDKLFGNVYHVWKQFFL